MIKLIIIILCIISVSSLKADELSISLAKIRNNKFFYFIAPLRANKDNKSWIPFCILLRNDGGKKIGIFDEDNSFGYDSIILEIKRGNKIFKITKRPKEWLRNLPTWSILFPNETLIIPFNPQVWENSSLLLENNDIQIRAIFSQRNTAEEEKIFQIDFFKKYSDLVFKGTIKSQWYSFKIEKDILIELIPVRSDGVTEPVSEK